MAVKKKKKIIKVPHYLRLKTANSTWLEKRAKSSKLPMNDIVDKLIDCERVREKEGCPSLVF